MYLTITKQLRLIHGGSVGGSGEKTGGVFCGYCRDDCDPCRGLTGYAAGGGVAYAISPNVSLFAEYLYINLGNVSGFNSVAVTSIKAASPSSFAANFSDVVFNVVRIGLNYKF